jgi:type IV pilus assembly protein PilE
MNSKKTLAAFTLVELMISVAIISVLAVIAIPAYNGYITEARIATAQSNMNSMKLFLEDYRLDNGCYTVNCGAATTYTTVATINTAYGWDPRKDDIGMTYALSVTDTTYAINVNFGSGWVNCPSAGNCTSSY